MTLRLLDLFCGAGGASEGYRQAGFDVVGVDIEPHRNPAVVQFLQLDAMDVLRDVWYLRSFDVIHASPPCQHYTRSTADHARHPDLVPEVRALLEESGVPYIIENVPGAPLRNPVTLCGAMFGLQTYRHRLFESSEPIVQPSHPEHVAPNTKMGRPPRTGEFMHVVGNFSGVARAREAMGIPWMTRDDLREAIPPAYTHFIGLQLHGIRSVIGDLNHDVLVDREEPDTGYGEGK